MFPMMSKASMALGVLIECMFIMTSRSLMAPSAQVASIPTCSDGSYGRHRNWALSFFHYATLGLLFPGTLGLRDSRNLQP